MDVNLDLNLAPPGGHPDQERAFSSVESNETSQQAQDQGVGTDDDNAASSSGRPGSFHQFMPQPAAPTGIHQAYPTGQLHQAYPTEQLPQPAYPIGQLPQPAYPIGQLHQAYPIGQLPQPAYPIGQLHQAYPTGQLPQLAYPTGQIGQPSQPAYQTEQPQSATILMLGAHQTVQTPGPASIGTDRVQQIGQPSVVTQNENQINSRRNESRIPEAEVEQGRMEQNRRRASYGCSYYSPGSINNNYGGLHGTTININNNAGGERREQNNPNSRQGHTDNSEINNNS